MTTTAAARCCLCGMPTAHDARFCHAHSWAGGATQTCGQKFGEWMRNGRSAPKEPGVKETLDLYLAFRHGWFDALDGKGDFARRGYGTNNRKAYMTGRLLAPRREPQ